MRRVAPLVLVS